MTDIAETIMLPESLYTAEGVQELDRLAIHDFDVPGFDLMQRAARAAFRQLGRRWPEARSVTVLCGAGNNGGDGYLIAAAAARQGMRVHCFAVADPAKLQGDAQRAYDTAIEAGIALTRADRVGQDQADAGATHDPGNTHKELRAALSNSGVVVDAMLGTGISGPLREPFATAVHLVNQSQKPVLAVDVPTGLDATTGRIPSEAVSAVVTVTYIGLKLGLLTGSGPDVSGELVFDALGVPQSVYSQITPVARRSSWSQMSTRLPVRRRGAHKGDCGHLLVIAGDLGFGGAGLLAAEAAARTGAGLVSLATRADYVGAALSRCPSLMVRGLEHGNELAPLLAAADGVVFGPGCGKGAWGQQMLQQVMDFEGPVLVDADGLNLLSGLSPQRRENWILTPHPGEAGRLLSCTAREVGENRLDAVNTLQARFGGVVLLKGAGTLVSGEKATLPVLVQGGNPGMATGGMGDVLSGMIGALMNQGLNTFDATVVGACLHGAAADRGAVDNGFMGLLPTDVIDRIPQVLSEAERFVYPPGSF
jgi:NAD(P)H-hydrate epimerase